MLRASDQGADIANFEIYTLGIPPLAAHASRLLLLAAFITCINQSSLQNDQRTDKAEAEIMLTSAVEEWL